MRWKKANMGRRTREKVCGSLLPARLRKMEKDRGLGSLKTVCEAALLPLAAAADTSHTHVQLGRATGKAAVIIRLATDLDW